MNNMRKFLAVHGENRSLKYILGNKTIFYFGILFWWLQLIICFDTLTWLNKKEYYVEHLIFCPLFAGSIALEQKSANVFCKGQIVNILVFACHMVIVTALLCCGSTKGAIDNTYGPVIVFQ